MDSTQLLLACFAVSPSKGYKPVQIQKLIFLFQEQTKSVFHIELFKFEPYNYGPFSIEVYQVLDNLINRGIVEIVYYPSDRTRTYQLMPNGEEEAHRSLNKMEAGAKEYLQKLASWVSNLSFAELVGSVYQQYPEQKINSVFNQ